MLKYREWADAATRAVGVWPGDLGERRDRIAIHAKTVWFGIVRENCPEIGLKDLSRLGGLKASAHSSCHACCTRWHELGWKERYGWLMLAEGKYEPSEDRKIWAASGVVREAVDTVGHIAEEIRKRQTSKPFRRINIPGHYDER